MPWRFVGRSELLENLEQAGTGANGAVELRRWLCEILLDADLEIDEAAASLVYMVVERLEVASATNFAQLAEDLARLIRSVPNNEAAKELIPLVEAREGVVDVLQKADDGRISRTAFLSYVAERNWSSTLKTSIASLTGDSMRELQRALRLRAYGALPALLSIS